MKKKVKKIEIHIGVNCALGNGRMSASLNDKRISLAEAKRLIKVHKLNRTEHHGYSYYFWDVFTKGKELKSEYPYMVEVK